MKKLKNKEKIIMRTLIKQTDVYYTYSEKEATDTVEEYKANQHVKGYTVLKTKIDYKIKKDRKTGEIIDEKWIVEITISYDE